MRRQGCLCSAAGALRQRPPAFMVLSCMALPWEGGSAGVRVGRPGWRGRGRRVWLGAARHAGADPPGLLPAGFTPPHQAGRQRRAAVPWGQPPRWAGRPGATGALQGGVRSSRGVRATRLYMRRRSGGTPADRGGRGAGMRERRAAGLEDLVVWSCPPVRSRSRCRDPPAAGAGNL